MTWKCAHPQQQHAQLLSLRLSLTWSVCWLPLSNPRNGKRSGQQQLVSSALRMTYKCRQKWTAVKDATVAGGIQLELTRLMSSRQQAAGKFARRLRGDFASREGGESRKKAGGAKKAPTLFAWLSASWLAAEEVEIRAPQSENQARVGRQLCGFAMCRLDNLWPRACTHTHTHRVRVKPTGIQRIIHKGSLADATMATEIFKNVFVFSTLLYFLCRNCRKTS